MFKQALRIVALASVFLSSLASAAEAEKVNQFLIGLNGGSQQSLAAAVKKAGGSLLNYMPDLGYATAVSDNPGFIKKLKTANEVSAVTNDVSIQWIPPIDEFELSPQDFDTGALGHVVDPELAAWGVCQWNLDQIDVQTAWAKGFYGDPGAKVAVLDSGVDPDHVDMIGQIDLVNSVSLVTPNDTSESQYCESYPLTIGRTETDSETIKDYMYHGAFVAAQIAAHGIVTAGVAPDTQIVGVKVLNCLGKGTFGDTIAGIYYAASLDDVSVINISLGDYLPRNQKGVGQLVAALGKAINYATTQGKLVVSAAGNDAADLQRDGRWIAVPAEAGNGIAAWAGDIDGGLASYSNHGGNAAPLGAGGGTGDIGSGQVPIPGCAVSVARQHAIVSPCSSHSVLPGLSSACSSGFAYLSGVTGTSVSAPLVSGVAALLAGKYGGDISTDDLKTALKESADDIGKKGVDNLFGKGRVNAGAAVDY